MNKVVTYARLQTETHIPNLGTLGNVFPPMNKVLEKLEMRALDGVLSITFNHKGFHKELLVPYGNVVLMEVAPSKHDGTPPSALL